MAFKVIEEKHEKVRDTNPNTYLKRAEDFIKKEKYPEALKAINTALEYGKDNPMVLAECNKVKPLIDPDIILEDYEIDLQEKNYKALKSKINEALKVSNNSYRVKEKCSEIERMILKNEINDSKIILKDIKSLVNEGNLRVASNKLESYEILKNTNSLEIKNEVKRLEDEIKNKRAKANEYIRKADEAINKKDIKEAKRCADLAVTYCIDIVIKEKQKHIHGKCKEVEIDLKASTLMSEAKNEFLARNYYDSIKKAEYATKCCKSYKIIYDKYNREYTYLLKAIYARPDYELFILAKKLEECGETKFAYELYDKTNLMEAQYRCGVILKKNNDYKKAKEKFEIAANGGNCDAIIEILREEKDVRKYNQMIFHYAEKFPEVQQKLNENKIKFIISDLKNECEKYISDKRYNLAINKIDEALKISQNALYIENLKKEILNDVKKAKELDIEIRNQELKAKKLIVEANTYYNNRMYYEAIKCTEEATKVCKDKKMFGKYKKIYNLLFDKIYKLPLDKKIEIADMLYKNNDLCIAKDIYSKIDLPETRYKEGLIYEKMNNIPKAKEILKKLADEGYDDAIISLIRLALDGKEKNELIFSHLEKNPKLIDKINKANIKPNVDEMIKKCNYSISQKEYDDVYRIINFAKKYFSNSNDVLEVCTKIQDTIDNIRISASEKIISRVNEYIKIGELDKASQELELLSDEVAIYENIKLEVKELNDKITENKNMAYTLLIEAKELVNKNKFEEAINLANKSLEYECSSENKKRIDEIHQLIDRVKLENYIEQLMTEANNEFNNEYYYNSVNLVDMAIESCKDNEDLYQNYCGIFDSFMEKIFSLGDDEIARIGNRFLMAGKIPKAKEYYKLSNSPEAKYQEGILLCQENNIKEALDKFVEASKQNHIGAIVSLIMITGTSSEYKNLNFANVNYKKLKKINKDEAKNTCYYMQTAYKVPQKDITYIKYKNIIDFRSKFIKFIIILTLITGIIIPVGFKIGLIKGKCISINVDLDNSDNYLLVNQKIDIKEKIKMKPSFAKKPKITIESSNDLIVETYDNYIFTNAEGSCVISFYCNGKKIKQIPVTVSNYIVESANIFTAIDLCNVGDTCTVYILFNGKGDKENCPIEITSSNEDVIEVNDRKLIAKGVGKCTIEVNVGSYTKELKYNIKRKKDSYDEEMQYSNSNTINDSSYILDCNNRYLSTDELEGISEEGLRYIINEIYARHGYIFKDEEFNEYFENKSWYSKNYDFDEKDFNKYEAYNIDLIVQYITDVYY